MKLEDLLATYGTSWVPNNKLLAHLDNEEINSLAHYGKLGMKWGVRRSTDSSGHVVETASSGHPGDTAAKAAPASAKVISEDHQKAMSALDKANQHGLSSLSTEEMRHLTNRLEAERKFHALTTEQKSEISKQVEQMRLEKEFNQLTRERAMAARSTGRKVLDGLLGDLGRIATQEASNYGKSLVKDMVGKKAPAPAKKAKPVKNLDEILKPYTKS